MKASVSSLSHRLLTCVIATLCASTAAAGLDSAYPAAASAAAAEAPGVPGSPLPTLPPQAPAEAPAAVRRPQPPAAGETTWHGAADPSQVAQADGLQLQRSLAVAPLSLITHQLTLRYQEALSPSWSLVFSPIYLWGGDSPYAYTGAGLGYMVSAAYYPAGKVLRGFHLEPFVGHFESFSRKNNRLSHFRVGGHLGHTWMSGRHVAISAALGVQYVLSQKETLTSNVLPSGRFNVGYVF